MTDTASLNLLPESVLAELGSQIGIPELKFDASGCCQLAFDGQWLVMIVHVASTQRWILACPLAVRNTTLTPGSQHAMLRANFMGSGCGGGSLAVSPDNRPCLIFQLAQSETSARALLDRIEFLLNEAETWSERLRAGESDRRSGADAVPRKSASALPSDGERPPVWMLDRI